METNQAVTIVQNAVNVLNALPNGAAIADFLEKQGVSGKQEHEDQCAVANWIDGMLDGEHKVTIYQNHIDLNGATIVAYIDTALSEFMSNFDNGNYPELVEDYEEDEDE